MRRAGQAGQARERALDALLDQVDIPLPEDLVDREIAQRAGESLADRLERAGKTMDEYLEATEPAGRAARRGVRRRTPGARSRPGSSWTSWRPQEELGVDQDELTAYVTEQAYRMGVSPDRLAQELTERGQLAAVAADVLRGKALTLLAERATVTDEAGRPVDVKAAVAGRRTPRPRRRGRRTRPTRRTSRRGRRRTTGEADSRRDRPGPAVTAPAAW